MGRIERTPGCAADRRPHPPSEAARVRRGAYGSGYDQLARLEARSAPENLFRRNQNTPPAA